MTSVAPLITDGEGHDLRTFKHRQYTPWVTVSFVSVAIILFGGGVALIVEACYFQVFNFGLVMGIISTFLFSLGSLYMAKSARWLEIEDKGDYLQVFIGPSLGIYAYYGFARIPYQQIESYQAPKSCCEECCGLCVGVNPCGCFGGLRGLGMRSLNCKQRQMIIAFRKQQKLQNSRFKRIAITIDAQHFDALKQLLDEKCGATV